MSLTPKDQQLFDRLVAGEISMDSKEADEFFERHPEERDRTVEMREIAGDLDALKDLQEQVLDDSANYQGDRKLRVEDLLAGRAPGGGAESGAAGDPSPGHARASNPDTNDRPDPKARIDRLDDARNSTGGSSQSTQQSVTRWKFLSAASTMVAAVILAAWLGGYFNPGPEQLGNGSRFDMQVELDGGPLFKWTAEDPTAEYLIEVFVEGEAEAIVRKDHLLETEWTPPAGSLDAYRGRKLTWKLTAKGSDPIPQNNTLEFTLDP